MSRCHVVLCHRQAVKPGGRHCHIHVAVSRARLYRVWAYLSTDVLAPISTIARETRMAPATVQAAICELARRGVLTREPHRMRARKLIEPFNWFDG